MKRTFATYCLILTLASLVLSSPLACSSDEPVRVEVGGQCDLNSDCQEDLVCRLGLCRVECRATRDCGGDLECLIGPGANSGVCQVPDETCDETSDCESDNQVCAFSQCLIPCDNGDDCPDDQTCLQDDDGQRACTSETAPSGGQGSGGAGGQSSAGAGGQSSAGTAGQSSGGTAGQSSAGEGGSTMTGGPTVDLGIPNVAPVANNEGTTTGVDEPVDITLQAFDANGDEVEFVVTEDPEHGTLSGEPPNVTYTPDNGFSGVDSFEFVANDGADDGQPGRITIVVTDSGCNGNFTIDEPEDLMDDAEITSCVAISGNLVITDLASSTGITDLSALSDLAIIQGTLTVTGTTALVDLTGLTSLTSIGAVTIADNASLVSAAGLSALNIIDGDVTITGNAMLQTMDGFDNVQQIRGDLNISDNALIDAFNQLSNLVSVGGDLTLEGNAALTGALGLNNLLSVGGTLRIANNPAWVEIGDFTSLQSVGDPVEQKGDLIVEDSPNADSVTLPSQLVIVGRDVTFSGNSTAGNVPSGLSSIRGLQSLRQVNGDLSVTENRVLLEVDELAVEHVTGDLIVDGNGFTCDAGACITQGGLPNLAAFANLSSIGGNLVIRGNRVLSNFDALTNLTDVGGDVIIEDNGRVNRDYNLGLTSIGGLSGLSAVAGDLTISSQQRLVSLDGLQNIASVGGRLTVSGNSAMESIGALGVLSNVGAGLSIHDNAKLPNLNGLTRLTEVGASFEVFGNAVLTDLHGAGSLESVGGDLAVYDNATLPTCEAEWLRDNIGTDKIDGAVNISGNDDAGVCE